MALRTPPTALDALPIPPCAQLLGWRLVDARPKEGWLRTRFEAGEAFLNPAGTIQGGLLAAMLDDTIGPAVFVHTEGALYTVTINLNVSYLAPALPGAVVGEAQVLQLGRSVGFVEASLRNEEGVMLAKAAATVRLVPTEKAVGRR